MSEPHTGSPPSERSETEREISKALAGDAPLPPLGFVRPLTDPEAVLRWRAMHAEPVVESEYDPLSRDRLP